MVSASVQIRLGQELDKIKAVQKDLQKAISIKQTLEGQLSENKVVQEELELLKSACKVYKMTGPVLVELETDEAKQNVEKRIIYITSEIKHNDEVMKDLGSKQEKQQEIIGKLQKEYSDNQQKALKGT